jgi:hypothetical protein
MKDTLSFNHSIMVSIFALYPTGSTFEIWF